MSHISMGSLLLIFLIVLLLFGTKRLRQVGEDLAVALKNFRKGMQEEERKHDSSLDAEKRIQEKELP